MSSLLSCDHRYRKKLTYLLLLLLSVIASAAGCGKKQLGTFLADLHEENLPLPADIKLRSQYTGLENLDLAQLPGSLVFANKSDSKKLYIYGKVPVGGYVPAARVTGELRYQSIVDNKWSANMAFLGLTGAMADSQRMEIIIQDVAAAQLPLDSIPFDTLLLLAKTPVLSEAAFSGFVIAVTYSTAEYKVYAQQSKDISAAVGPVFRSGGMIFSAKSNYALHKMIGMTIVPLDLVKSGRYGPELGFDGPIGDSTIDMSREAMGIPGQVDSIITWQRE